MDLYTASLRKLYAQDDVDFERTLFDISRRGGRIVSLTASGRNGEVNAAEADLLRYCSLTEREARTVPDRLDLLTAGIGQKLDRINERRGYKLRIGAIAV